MRSFVACVETSRVSCVENSITSSIISPVCSSRMFYKLISGETSPYIHRISQFWRQLPNQSVKLQSVFVVSFRFCWPVSSDGGSRLKTQ